MTYVVVVADGLTNSVAASQIIEPLKRYHTAHPEHECFLISFERTLLPSLQQEIKQQLPFATLHIHQRLPFLGRWSLYAMVHRLRHILRAYPGYHIVARGPLAGFIALKSMDARCTTLTIQARSLLAQEYKMVHPAGSWYHPRTWVHAVRARQLHALEQYVYGVRSSTVPVTIEAVSHALSHYLQKTYGTPATCITIAQDDIPATIALEQIIAWRIQTRQELGIAQEAVIYCYNGSIKPWQCIDQVIAFFIQKIKEDKESLLLILTQDSTAMQAHVTAHQLENSSYRIVSCAHSDIYRYLSAADFGIILRKPHIINWTSRPTKVLEYQAVGLPIIHNNTIAMLVDKKDTPCCSH